MRKVNRVLMKTVAILLVLVLITSCTLSGIFAKYVTTLGINLKNMEMKQFGVTVNMVVDEAKLESVFGDDYYSAEELKALPSDADREAVKASKIWLEVSTDAQKQAGVNTVTIHNLALKPGDKLEDFVSFALSGKPNVMCKLVLDVDLVIDNPDDFYVPPDVFKPSNGSNMGLYELPLGFDYDLISGKEDVAKYDIYCEPYCLDSYYAEYYFMCYYALFWEFYDAGYQTYTFLTNLNPDADSDEDIDYAIEQIIDVDGNFCSMSGAKTDIENDGVGFLVYDNNYNPCVIDKLNFSITWPFTHNEIANGRDGDYDVANTYVANNNPSMSVSYTVKVEQVTSVDDFSDDWIY